MIHSQDTSEYLGQMPPADPSVNVTAGTCGDVPTAPKQEPIAIIGMAAHTPGATNTNELWELLEKGINTASKIPEDRFKVPAHLAACQPSSTRESQVEMGNFMNEFAEFDNKFFKISPREAKNMDPQQRMLLHTAYEALESAGYVPDATPCFQRSTFGCYVATATREYCENLNSNIDVHYITGTLKAFLGGRISYVMQFEGPSIVVDTACSGSIVTLHQACRALMLRDCNAALAGGVNVMTSPISFVALERGHFLGPTGQCKAFDASASGYGRGEGCCMLVLKRLSDAIAENDNIMGVIRGIELNQCGRATSITHPHAPTQAALLKSLLDNSCIKPTSVSVVEAHGTGTEAGDPCELGSIRSVISQGRTRENPLYITSIKGNIGHLEAASGAISLCKLVLMLRNSMIPAQTSLKTLNPLIAPLELDNTVISTVPVPWVAGSTPRRAVVNNFGAAGSNGALVMEEYSQPSRQPIYSTFVFGISAKSTGALEKMRSQYIDFLGNARNHNLPLCDIAYTATARRHIYPYRLVVCATDKDQLNRALNTSPIAHVESPGGRVIFVFPGQGSQYLDMGATLYTISAVFRSCIDRCERYLLSLGYHSILPIVSSRSSDIVFGADEEFEAYQCAVLAVEFALSSLWKHWGVIPAGVIGHSLGEYAAMVAADVLSIETALSIVAKRARLMSQGCALGKTGMVSITLPSTQVQEVLATHGSFANSTVACVNTDSSCVVSGPVEELQTLAAHLKSQFNCKTATLQVSLGFHSAAMDPILDDLTAHVATLPIQPPSIPIASNLYGTVIPVGDTTTFEAAYFAKHCRQPVQFSQGLRGLEKCGDASRIDAWIDVGPHPICVPMVKSTLSPSPETLCLPSMNKDASGWDTLMGSLAQLYRTNVPVNWRRVFDERGVCSCVELPLYPFETQRFLVPWNGWMVPPTSESTPKRQTVDPAPKRQVPDHPPPPKAPDHPMLSSWSQYPSRQNGGVAIFETSVATLVDYIEGHSTGEYALCPMSVFLEQSMGGAIIAQRHMGLDFGKCVPVLQGIHCPGPLVYRKGVTRVVRTYVTLCEDGTGSFKVTSRLDSSDEEQLHGEGTLRFAPAQETTSNLALDLPAIVRSADAPPPHGKTPETFSSRTIYDVMLPRVVNYSKAYRGMQSLTVNRDDTCVARVCLPGLLGAHSIFMDTLVQAPGFMPNVQCDATDGYICSAVGTLTLVRDLIVNNRPYILYSTSKWSASRDGVIVDVIAVQESNPSVPVAQLKGLEFRRVQVTRIHRFLALAAGPVDKNARKSAHSKSTPSASLRNGAPAHSRANGHASKSGGTTPDVDGDADELRTNYSVQSSQTAVSQGRGTSEKPRSSVGGDRIRKVMAEVLGMDDVAEIKDDVDFESLGLDSLGTIEAHHALRAALQKPIPHDIFTKCTTLLSLCDFLGEGSMNGVAVEEKIPVVEKTRTVEPPRSGTGANGKLVRQVMAEVLGMDDVAELKDDVDFESLGLDSLGTIEAHHALRAALQKSIPHDIFTNCTTVSALCEFLGDGPRTPVNADVKRTSTVEKVRTVETPRTSTGADAKVIRQVMAEVLGMEDSAEIQDDVDFEALGLDSLGTIEAHHALRAALQKPIPHDIFTTCTTLSSLCDFLGDGPKNAAAKNGVTKKHVSAAETGGRKTPICRNPEVDLVPLQQYPGSSRTPLFLVHDGSGLSRHYEHISPLDRDLWGIGNPTFFTDETWETLEDMALAYARAIEKQANDSAVMVGGWSFGGTAAFEIARILTGRGIKVKGVVLLDSPPPLAPPVTDEFLNRILRAWGHAASSPRTGLIFRQFKQCSGLLANYVARPLDVEVPLAFLHSMEGFTLGGTDGVPPWFHKRDDITEIVGPWEDFVGQTVPYWNVPGNHFELFSPDIVKETSAQLARACEYLETL